MCGIVGYISNENSKEFILNGLKKLEYRGYDSSGIAFAYPNQIKVFKKAGRVQVLENLIPKNVNSGIGIAHTRWATHGGPSDINSHPHTSMNHKITLVHNGVIENYIALKQRLKSKGYTFQSDTDSEVLANLLEFEYEKNHSFPIALRNALQQVRGSYALCILVESESDKIYCAKNKTPLLIAHADSFTMVASDIIAMLEKSETFVEMLDQEYAILTKDQVSLYSFEGIIQTRDYFKTTLTPQNAECYPYDSFMEKEMEEQPTILRNIIHTYYTKGVLNVSKAILRELMNASTIYIIASGTSYHAGLIGMYAMKHLASKKVEVFLGSEFAYDIPLLDKHSFFIFLSQSGETADSRVALKELRNYSFKTLSITNSPDSTLSRECDYSLPLCAGLEIAVASTKAYTAQVLLMVMLAFECSNQVVSLPNELEKTAVVMESILKQKEAICSVVQQSLVHSRNCFYIGRLQDYYITLEASLKLKEVSYIQCEGYPAAELKHGSIALIEQGTPVLAFISKKSIALATRSALQEVKARGATTLSIVNKSNATKEDTFIYEDVYEYLNALPMILYGQLIALYSATLKGLDIDKPRNLAKSVSVE